MPETEPAVHSPTPSTSYYATFGNEEDGNKTRGEYTVEEAIEKIGFGPFQLFCLFGAGFAWIADSMEVMVLSILGPTLLCEWSLSKFQEAMITTVVFMGCIAGSPVFGYFADKFGRRKSLLLSSMWISFYGVVSSLSPEYGWLLFLRFLVGFGVGGAPQAVTYCVEFLPNETRGRAIILVEVFYAFGGAMEVMLAILVLRPYGWHAWLAVSAVPSLIFVIICYFLPNSPRFDLITNNAANAQRTLEIAARWNGSELPEGKLVLEPSVPRGQLMDMWRPEYRLSTCLLIFLWFADAGCYFGTALFTTDMVQVGNTCDPTAFGSVTITNGTCQSLTLAEYGDLLWTSAAELPGLLITALLIDSIGRRATLIVQNFLYGVTCMLLFICMQRGPMVVLLFVARALAASVFQVLFLYTPEVYPTEVRALSMGAVAMFGRLGALLSPHVSEVLLDISLYYGLGVYAGVAFLASVISYLLPVETSGSSL